MFLSSEQTPTVRIQYWREQMKPQTKKDHEAPKLPQIFTKVP